MGVGGSTADLRSEKSLEMPASLSPGKFEMGKAEALGALCRIFCHKKTNEDISPLYLARFYLALQKGLAVQKKSPISDTLGMIFVNACSLFRSNLEGINIVLPHFVAALEVILAEKDPKVQLHSVTHAEVRRSAIQILLSILPLPQHFMVSLINAFLNRLNLRIFFLIWLKSPSKGAKNYPEHYPPKEKILRIVIWHIFWGEI